MMIRRKLLRIICDSLPTIFFLVMACWSGPAAFGQLAQKSDEDSLSQQLLGSVDWHRPFRSASREQALEVRTVLKFGNPTRVRISEEGIDGMVLFCIDRGKPVAAIHTYVSAGFIWHEMDYLERVPSFSDKIDGSVLWNPSVSGVSFRTYDASYKPSTQDNSRLRQMKDLARSFRCIFTGWSGEDRDREDLRLMPQPLFRYELGDSSQSGATIDGMVVAFAQGNDPEALLVIEAVQDEEGGHWEYAFTRATSGGLEAFLGSDRVWEAERNPKQSDPSLPHFCFKKQQK